MMGTGFFGKRQGTNLGRIEGMSRIVAQKKRLLETPFGADEEWDCGVRHRGSLQDAGTTENG
jgi:hypothetical protein